MNKPESSRKPVGERNLHFRLMSLTYGFRDFIRPRITILKEAGIQPGSHVLDYGCGPGSYVRPLAELAGPLGKIYALDMHPLAVRMVKRLASRRKLANVETIQSNCRTGLPDACVDVVLLYDVFHGLDNSNEVLRELHRVLKSGGSLSFSDHHLGESEIVSALTQEGLFRMVGRGRRTFPFQKTG